MLARPRVLSPFRRRDPRTWRRRTAKRLGPPLFAIKGAGAPHRGGFGWSSEGTYHVSVVQTGTQGEVTVETGSDRPFFDEWMLLQRWLHEAVDPRPAADLPCRWPLRRPMGCEDHLRRSAIRVHLRGKSGLVGRSGSRRGQAGSAARSRAHRRPAAGSGDRARRQRSHLIRHSREACGQANCPGHAYDLNHPNGPAAARTPYVTTPVGSDESASPASAPELGRRRQRQNSASSSARARPWS